MQATAGHKFEAAVGLLTRGHEAFISKRPAIWVEHRAV